MANYYVYSKVGVTDRYDRVAFSAGHEMNPAVVAQIASENGYEVEGPVVLTVADDFDLASIEYDADGNLQAIDQAEAARRDAAGEP